MLIRSSVSTRAGIVRYAFAVLSSICALLGTCADGAHRATKNATRCPTFRVTSGCAEKGHLKLCEFLSKLNTKHGHYSIMQPLRLKQIGQQWGMASPSLLMELVKAWLPAAGQPSTTKPEFASYCCGVTKRNTLIGQPMSNGHTSWARQESTKE